MNKLLKDVFTYITGQPLFVVPDEGGAASGGSGGQGNSGDNLPEIDSALSDLNLEALSKLPEEDKKAILGEFTTKVKNLQAIGTKKSEELADKFKEYESKIADAKVVEDIRKNPELSKAIEKTLDDFRAGKLNDKSDTGDVFDEWIDKAGTPQEAKNLEKLRDEIRKGDNSSKEQIDLLTKEISLLKTTTRTIHTDRATRGVNHLTESFGKEIIDKYSSKLNAWMTKYPQQEGETFQKYAEQALFNIATPEDYRIAFRKELELTQTRETQRRKGGLEPGGAGETGTEVEVPKDKNGKINIGKYATNLVKSLGLGKNL